MGDENIRKRIFSYIAFDATHLSFYIVKSYFLFIKDKLNSMIYKTTDLSLEALHWRRYYNEQNIKNSLKTLLLPGETKESIKLAVKYLEDKKLKKINCLDVGCGPISQFYSEFFQDTINYNIISVDPLAKVYNEIHERYKSLYNIVCLEGFGENLQELFFDNNFDLIYSQNAIDHSQDPISFIDSCYKVLKNEGLLILHGFIKEGTAARWLGLHNWNIEVKGNDLLLTDKAKKFNRYNLTKDYNFTVLYRVVTGKNISDTYTFIFLKNEENEN